MSPLVAISLIYAVRIHRDGLQLRHPEPRFHRSDGHRETPIQRHSSGHALGLARFNGARLETRKAFHMEQCGCQRQCSCLWVDPQLRGRHVNRVLDQLAGAVKVQAAFVGIDLTQTRHFGFRFGLRGQNLHHRDLLRRIGMVKSVCRFALPDRQCGYLEWGRSGARCIP